MEGVSMAHIPEQAPACLKVSNFQRLMNCIQEGWVKELVLFAVPTGMRKGEILNLKWSDVDLGRRILDIETSLLFKTKFGKRRTIPLNESALLVLKGRITRSASEYVFTLSDKALNSGCVTHMFKRNVRSSGLTAQRLQFHSPRHTFASWLVQGGASLYEVQGLLGHSSAKVTEIYNHL